MPTWNTPYNPKAAGSGRRDRPVLVQFVTDATEDSGFPTEAWETLIDIYWCSKQDISGYIKVEAGQASAPFQTRFEGHYRTDMDPERINIVKERRFVFAGRTYDIIAASLIGMHHGVEYLTIGRMG
jgi:head-tail adaptor